MEQLTRRYAAWIQKASEFATQDKHLKKEVGRALAWFRMARPLPQQPEEQSVPLGRFYAWFLLDRASRAYREPAMATFVRKRAGSLAPADRAFLTALPHSRLDLFEVVESRPERGELRLRSRTAADRAELDPVRAGEDAAGLDPGDRLAARVLPAPQGGWFLGGSVALAEEGERLLTARRPPPPEGGVRADDLEAVLLGVTELMRPEEPPSLRMVDRKGILRALAPLLDEGRLAVDEATLAARAEAHDDARAFMQSVLDEGDFANEEARVETGAILLALWQATPRASLAGRAPREDTVPHSREAAMQRVQRLMQEDLGGERLQRIATQAPPGQTEAWLQQAMAQWQRTSHPALNGRTPLAYMMEAGAREMEKRVASQPRRNHPCPCGSGKKFKLCCGAEAEG